MSSKKKETLEAKRLALPRRPGVYLFKNQAGKIIYIGKALSLRHRVASYFNRSPKDPKTSLLVSKIADLDWLELNSEFEALVLEAKLVREHLPKYNIQLRDDKHPLYIGITREKYPRVFALRRPELAEGLIEWFGPFLSGRDVRHLLRLVRRIFPYRTCESLPAKPCLDYHLKLCPGPCLESLEEYGKAIRRLKLLFSGRTSALVRQLAGEMKSLADRERFEEAQAVKFQLQALESLTSRWSQVPVEKLSVAKALEEVRELLIRWQNVDVKILYRIEGYDISNLSDQIIVGAEVVFIEGEAAKGEYRKFKITFKTEGVAARQNLREQNDAEAMSQVISRRLGHPEWLYPQLILVDGGKPQVSAAFRALEENGLHKQIGLVGLAKKEEVLVIPRLKQGKISGYKQVKLAARSEGLRLLQQIRDEAHRFAQKYYHLLQSRKLLD